MAVTHEEQRSAGLDVARIRKDFPILERTVEGKPLVYLDSAATSQKPNQVIDAEADFYRNHNANAHRGIYLLAEETTELYEQARGKLARFIGAPQPETIVFTRGTTESTNLVAYAWARKFLREGDEIRTEISCKYTRASLEALLPETGLRVSRWFTDPEDLFGLALLTRRGAERPQ